jgi:ribonuclease P protein component
VLNAAASGKGLFLLVETSKSRYYNAMQFCACKGKNSVIAGDGAGLKRLTFPKVRRLITSKQFKAVLDCRRRARGDLLTIYLAPNECGYARLGVSVAKSCGGAVVRNRLKRLIRESFRLSQGSLSGNCDYLVMVSPAWIQRHSKSGTLKEAAMALSLREVKGEFGALMHSVTRDTPPKA